MRLRAVLVVVGACADGSDTGEGGPTSTTTTQVPTTTTTQVPTTTTTLPVPTVTWPRYPDWLVDVEWLVIGVEMDGVPVDRPEGAEAHVTFESDGILAGSLGCNGFGSGYDDFENPGFISVGMTMARCEDVEDWVEVADVLQGVYEDTGFSLDRDEATGTAVLATAIGVLNLRDPDPPESSSAWPTFSDWLVGVEWQVTAVEFGGEPIDRPEGAEAFVVFEPDGLLSGHLGCNGLGVYFVGTFEQPESISVGSTDMGCEVKDWYEVAYVPQGVYDNGITSLRQHEATGTVWLSTAYGLLELHDPAVVPSQTPTEAARDSVVPELAAYPYGFRVKALLEVPSEEGTWMLASPTDQLEEISWESGCAIGNPDGENVVDVICSIEYGEILLTDGGERILKASRPPSTVVVRGGTTHLRWPDRRWLLPHVDAGAHRARDPGDHRDRHPYGHDRSRHAPAELVRGDQGACRGVRGTVRPTG